MVAKKKKVPGQITCARDLAKSITAFEMHHGVALSWMQDHMQLFTEGRSTLFFNEKEHTFNMVEPNCGLVMQVLGPEQVAVMHPNVDIRDHLNLSVLWSPKYNTKRPEIADNRAFELDKRQFLDITMMRVFRKWVSEMTATAKFSGFEVIYTAGKKYMIVLIDEHGKKIGFAV